MSPKLRRVLYPVLGVWLVLLAGGLVYLKTSRDETPGDEQRKAASAQIAKEESTASSQRQQSLQSSARGVGEVNGDAVVGSAAPKFTLADASGRKVKLASLRGQPVVVEFFASWCPHCRAMAPVFAQEMRKYPKVKYLMVAAAREKKSTVVRWHQTFLGKPMPSTLLLDPTLAVARAYSVTGYPTTAFIDRNGVLRKSVSGEFSTTAMRNNLAAISR